MAITSEEQHRQMLNDPIGGLLFRKALPTVMIQLITIIYNTADTYFVAKINTSASAAVGVVFSLMSIIQAVGYGIGMGSSSLISRSLGAEKNDDANRYGTSAVFAGLISGTIILIFGLIFLSQFMKLLGASATVLPYACDYAEFILIGAPFMCVSFILSNILRAEGQSFFSMISTLAGGILNLGLDPLFIFVFKMGIRGAAIATIIGQFTSMTILIIFFSIGKTIVKVRPRFVSPKPGTYILIFRTGVPTIFRQGMGSLSSALLNNQAMLYGDAAVAAISITNKIYMLVRSITLGLGQGAQPIMGYCFGAKNNKRVRKVFWTTAFTGTAIGLIVTAAIFIFRTPIITWFRDDPEVIAIGSQALLFACTAFWTLAFSTYVNHLYQCLGFPLGATLLACCRQGFFFVPLVFILPKLFGISGIELLQPTADVLTFIVAIPAMLLFFRKHLRIDAQLPGGKY